MKTYLSMICFIVLCGCQSYNRLSGGGFYTKFSQEPKEVEKLKNLSDEILITDTEEQLDALAVEENSSEDTVEKETIDYKNFEQEQEQIEIHTTVEISDNQQTLTEDKYPVIPLSIIAFSISILNIIGLILFIIAAFSTAISLVSLGGIGIAVILLSVTSLILAIIALVKMSKDMNKYSKSRVFISIALCFSTIALILGIGCALFLS